MTGGSAAASRIVGLRLLHLALVLVGGGQQVEVVDVVPVELGGDPLRRVVGPLQLVGPAEGGDGVVDAPHAAQVVAPHVVRVRDRGREARVGLAVLERGRDLADRLVGVGQVVVRGPVVGREPQRRR